MKHIVELLLFYCCLLIMIVTLGNWGNTESSIESDKKQQVNFYGTLLTHQTETPLAIDNISIGGKYKQIPLIERPTATKDKGDPQSTSISTKNSRSEIALDVDPKTDLVTTKIDLNEVSEIQIPNPHTIWTYQKENTYRKLEFLEVIISSNNTQKTKAHYLLESRTKIYCNEINDAGPIQKEVPLAAINSLKIAGYKYRTIAANGTHQSACACEPQPPCGKTAAPQK